MNTQTLIDSSSVILASGGARGITAQCVIKLAEQHQCKFILLGRSSIEDPEPEWAQGCDDESTLKKRIMENLKNGDRKPTPADVQRTYKKIQAKREVEQTLHTIKKAGGQAEYVSADITNRDSIHEKLTAPTQHFGPVTGIIHGAGNLADKLIEKKSQQDFENVYSPKVDGLENLLGEISPAQLRFLVLFSSIVGFYGNVGQSDYAIANEVLNKTAYHIQHKYPQCKVMSINWGPWDAGMVTPALKKAFEERNITLIPTQVGVKMLAETLASPNNQQATQVVVGTPPVQPTEALTNDLRKFQIYRNLTLEANPFLFDHMIGEHPVLPATCAASWAVSSCEQLYPGYRFLSLKNFKVLKGIVFDQNLAKEYILDLQEVSKDTKEGIEFDAMIWSKGKNGRTQYHFSLRIKLVPQVPEAPYHPLPDTNIDESTIISGQQLYENGTLFHGPSFQGIERVIHLSRGKMTLLCNLPKIDDNHQGQFPVQTSNPYIYDAIVQSLLIWTRKYYDAPCLPAAIKHLEQYKAIPFETPCYVNMEIQSQSEHNVIGNITVQDKQGQIYMRIDGVEGTLSKHLTKLFAISKTQ